MKIGAKIEFYNARMREERKRQSLSQKQLAEMVGETITTIQFVETLRQPSRSMNAVAAALPKIASALGVETEYLFPNEYLMALQKKFLPKTTTLIIAREVPMNEIRGMERHLAIEPPDEQAERIDDVRITHKLLEFLSERDRKVIELLYGLSDGEEKTLEKAGEILSVTSERVRQIEAHALRKLRFHAGKLIDFSRGT